MSITDKLRRVAGYLVELPEEPTKLDSTKSNSEATKTALNFSSTDDLDKRLADLEAVSNGAKPSKTIEEIVQAAPGPNLNQITMQVSGAPPLSEDGMLDFVSLYKQAKLPSANYTAEQALAMLNQLPTNLPLDVKRQTVKVMLSSLGASMGATPETIVADASRKLAALAAFTQAQQDHTKEFISAAEFEIAELQKQIEEKKSEIKATTDRLSQAQSACEAEADHLDDILEFFSLDVGASKYAPPVL